jgi:predicted ArsR family transcriptional regulator
LLGETSRARLLAVLRAADEPQDVHALARAVGLHANTTREHLDRLVDAGLVQVMPATDGAPGRPRLLYESVVAGGAGPRDEDAYRVLAGVLAAEIARSADPRTSIAEAGARWGRVLARAGGPLSGGSEVEAVDRLVEVLADVGFAPRLPDGGGPIELHACPFRDLAEERPDVVCGVHLGLMRGALAELGAPIRAVGLRPFVGLELCLAEVGAGTRGHD